jgi:hypothetical protein
MRQETIETRSTEELEFMAQELERAVAENEPDSYIQSLAQAVEELEADLYNPSFGQGVGLPDGGMRVSPFPGVDVTFPAEGTPSIGVEGQSLFEGAAPTLQNTLATGMRTGARAGRDALQGVLGAVRYAAPPSQQAVVGAMLDANQLPQVEVANDAERIAAAGVQYGVPGGYAGMFASRALASLPWFARVAGATAAAGVADAAVTDPQQAATIGDAVTGLTGLDTPTTVQDDDSDIVRRLKVGAEAGGITVGLGVLREGTVPAFRAAWRLVSNDEEARQIVANYMRRAYKAGAATGDETPIDEARSALAELIEARRVYASEGIEAVPQEMQRFVANDVQFTTADYLAARGINFGALEIGQQVGQSAAVVQRRAENVRAVGQAAEDTLETSDPGAGARLGQQAQSGVQRADEASLQAIDDLYRSVEADMQQASQRADEAIASVQGAMERADELRAAGRIEEAVRVERQAAMDMRDAIYRSIDPNGTVRVGPQFVRDSFEELEKAVEATEITGFRTIRNALNRVNEAQEAGTLSYRDILDFEQSVSRVINNGSEGSQVYFRELVDFRNRIQDHYLDRVSATRPFAAQVATEARSFVREQFAPRFRQFAGADAEGQYRGQAGVSSGQMSAEFLNTGSARADDAATLNRILQGTSVEPSSAAGRGLRRQGRGTATATPEEYAERVDSVRDVLLARMLQGIDPSKINSAVAQRFISRYSDTIDQFPPQLREELESVARSLDDAQNLDAARAVLDKAMGSANVLRNNRIGNITPRTDINRIERIADQLRQANASPEALEAAARARAAAEERQAVAEKTLTRFFASRGRGANAQVGMRNIMASENPSANIQQLIDEVGDIEAVRQGMTDFLLNDITRLSPDQRPQTLLTAMRQLENYFNNDRYREALRAVYGPDVLRSFRRFSSQMRDMRFMDTRIDSRLFDKPVADQGVLRNLQRALEELAGASEGMTGRVRQRSRNELINRVRGLVSSDSSLEDLVNQRLIEVTLNPEAAHIALRPFSEAETRMLARVLMESGHSAYIAAARALEEDRQQQAINGTLSRDYRGL